MKKRRLLKLADFLDNLPRKNFDYATIWKGPDVKKLGKGCGSVGCAIGWMPTVFSRSGLYRKTIEHDPDYAFEVAATFFGITYEEAEFLFTPGDLTDGISGLDDTATPKQVAKHIRKFVEHDGIYRFTRASDW